MTNEPICVGTGFLAQLKEGPDKTFIIQDGIETSRLEFACKAAGLRSYFEDEGVGPNSVVGLSNTNQVTTFEAIFAIWSLGAAPFTLDFRTSSDEHEHLVKIAGITHTFSDFKGFLNRPGITLLPRGDSLVGDTDALKFPVNPDAFVEFVQTSGTTARPKIKQKSSDNLFSYVTSLCNSNRLGKQGNIVSCLNLAFPGTRYQWYRNAISGRKIISVPVFFKFSELDAALLHCDAEETTLAPIIMTKLVAHLEQTGKATEKPRYPNLAKFQSIGGPLIGEELLNAKRVLSRILSVTYSSSETGLISRLVADEMDRQPNSVGKITTGVSVSILSDANDQLPAGKVGNICVTIEGKKKFPNDLGFIDQNGYLHVTGRNADNLCRNGVSFSAGDAEKRIRAFKGVEDCCVFAIPAQTLGEDEVAVAIEGDSKLSLYIKDRLRMDMLALIRPSQMQIFGNLPRTSGMKIAKNKLQRQYLENPGSYDDV